MDGRKEGRKKDRKNERKEGRKGEREEGREREREREREKERKKEGHMVKVNSTRGETYCHYNMGYTFRPPASILLYAPSYRQDNTEQAIC